MSQVQYLNTLYLSDNMVDFIVKYMHNLKKLPYFCDGSMDIISHTKLRLRFPTEDVVHFSQLFEPQLSINTISKNLQHLTLVLPELPSQLDFSCMEKLSALTIIIKKASPKSISESKVSSCMSLENLYFEAEMDRPIMCSKRLIEDICSPLDTIVIKNTSNKTMEEHTESEEYELINFWENVLNTTENLVSLHDIFTCCCTHCASVMELLDTMFYFCKLPKKLE